MITFKFQKAGVVFMYLSHLWYSVSITSARHKLCHSIKPLHSSLQTHRPIKARLWCWNKHQN